MEPEILDLGFLYDISGNDPIYIHDVINLFLNIVPEGISRLEQLVFKTEDFDAIHKQAHFLKSSAAIVKINDMYDDLTKIIALSMENKGKEEMTARMNNLLGNFQKALPLILSEKEKYRKVIS